MTMQNVITLSEEGLLLDTFADDRKHYNACLLAKKQHILVFADSSSVFIFDLKINKIVKDYNIGDVKDIKLSECGYVCAVTTYSRRLLVFNHEDIICEFEKVENFEISSDYLVFTSKCILHIYEIVSKMVIETIDNSVKFILNEKCLVYTTLKDKNGTTSLVCKKLRNNEFVKTYQFPNIEDYRHKTSDDSSMMLILITTEYVANSYFGTSSLFLLNCGDGLLTEFTTLPHVIFFDFMGSDIIVCNGHQPSDFIIFDQNMKEQKKFPKGVRNRAFFNPHGNLVCFAGFDSLNGMVEIYSKELLTKFQVLGASEVIWSPCGSYFIVAITNKLKVDNQVIIYDYFGRIINRKNFRNLISCFWYGDTQNFMELERPTVLNILKEEGYVPPHLRKDNKNLHNSKERSSSTKPFSKKDNKSKKTNKKNVDKQKGGNNNVESVVEVKKEMSVTELKKELEEISKLKERITKGECLDMNSMNKILREDELVRKLKNL